MNDTITMALAGNPNAGKTTLFNALTGSHQHVGNYPGITVEKKQGLIVHGDSEFHVVDLPGTYSLTAYSQEELVARNYLVDERPDVVVTVLNAGALERNLYLAVQILELGLPTLLALNMMDEARAQGMRIDSGLLSRLLGLPVVETVARQGLGKEELLRKAQALAVERRGEWKPLSISYGPDLDPVLAGMTKKIEEAAFLGRYPARWVALKYMEGDAEIMRLGRQAGPLSAELEQAVADVAAHCRLTLDTYPEAIIADYRYGFIASLLKQGVVRRDTHQERIALSDRMDKAITHRLLGPIIMFAVLYAVYQITFTIGRAPTEWLAAFFAWLGQVVGDAMPHSLLRSLVVSGMIDGVGGVISFVPLIMFMFMLIAFLEDSGYMARIAYMLDRVFRIFGLHGCSVMPFIVSGGIAGGCAVPGVMAARTLRSPKERLATILTAPFMTCGAKLPVFILLVGVFFPAHQALAMFLITVGAWTAALLVALLLRSTVIKGPATPFVMELPPYRMPTVRGMLIHTWERTWQYLRKAGTVILAISILLWAAMTFPKPPQQIVEGMEAKTAAYQELLAKADAGELAMSDAERAEARQAAADAEHAGAEMQLRHSAAGRLGTALEPLTRHAGFDWRTNIALIGGFAAKEVIISTLGTAYSLGQVSKEESAPLAERLGADPHWTTPVALAVIIFILLYSPCLVTVVAIYQETKSWGWALFSMGFNTTLAFALAVTAYQAGIWAAG